jgi:nucleotide-binding universal stress UspA family protein
LIRDTHPIEKAGQIVVALDTRTESPLEDELNKRMMQYGAALANLFETDLNVVTAWALKGAAFLRGSMESGKFLKAYSTARNGAEERLEGYCAGVSLKHGSVTPHFLEGEPGNVVAEYCTKNTVHTLVLGTVGRSGLLGYLVGNTAEHLLTRVSCSVLIVSPKEASSPVELFVEEELQNLSDAGALA